MINQSGATKTINAHQYGLDKNEVTDLKRIIESQKSSTLNLFHPTYGTKLANSVSVYQTVTKLLEEHNTTPFYIKITNGVYTGSILKVTKIKTNNTNGAFELYSEPLASYYRYYTLIPNSWKFYTKPGPNAKATAFSQKQFSILLDYTGSEVVIYTPTTVNVKTLTDRLGQPLGLDDLIFFPQASSKTSVSMLFGKITKITKSNTIYATSIKLSEKEYVRDCIVYSPQAALKITDNLHDLVLMAKLSA